MVAEVRESRYLDLSSGSFGLCLKLGMQVKGSDVCHDSLATAHKQLSQLADRQLL